MRITHRVTFNIPHFMSKMLLILQAKMRLFELRRCEPKNSCGCSSFGPTWSWYQKILATVLLRKIRALSYAASVSSRVILRI